MRLYEYMETKVDELMSKYLTSTSTDDEMIILVDQAIAAIKHRMRLDDILNGFVNQRGRWSDIQKSAHEIVSGLFISQGGDDTRILGEMIDELETYKILQRHRYFDFHENTKTKN